MTTVLVSSSLGVTMLVELREYGYWRSVCPSIVVESLILVLGATSLSDSQLDVYQTIVVLLNLCQSIKFAGNFVFYARLRDTNCLSSGRRTNVERSAMALSRFRTFDAVVASARRTDQLCVMHGSAAETVLSRSSSSHRRLSSTAKTVAVL